MLRKWEKLPIQMRNEAVLPYYEILKKKKISLLMKRIFDVVLASILLVILSPLMIGILILIVTDSQGGAFYCQERITQYGKKFKIFKFRTMVANADKIGTQITVHNDNRITRVGEKLRRYRLDEIPQLINIILGQMSFVGTRPETLYYVKNYTPEMFATLLLPAGVTSEACVRFRDEAAMLEKAENASEVYIKKILPQKMEYNLKSIKEYSFLREIGIMVKTVLAVIRL